MISVIVPVYNVEKYLGCCVESLCRQTCSDIEFILIDDGSTDASGKLCDEYAREDSRIRVIHKENGGLSSARNEGISCARGQYIGFVDSDDFIHPQMYTSLYNMIEEYHAEIAVCRFGYVEETAKQYEKHTDGEIIGDFSGEQALWNLMSSDSMLNSGIMCDKLFDKTLFDEIRFPVGKYHEDEYVIYKLFHHANKVVYSSYPYYYYRKRGGSITNTYSIHNLDMLAAYENRAVYYKEQGYEELYCKALERYLHLLTYHYFQMLKFYPKKRDMRKELCKKVEVVLNENKLYISNKMTNAYKLFMICPIIYKILQKMKFIAAD